jgi:hypothetical protein
VVTACVRDERAQWPGAEGRLRLVRWIVAEAPWFVVLSTATFVIVATMFSGGGGDYSEILQVCEIEGKDC